MNLTDIRRGNGTINVTASNDGLIAVEFGGQVLLYRADLSGKTFSKLTEINVSNVKDIALSPSGDKLYITFE